MQRRTFLHCFPSALAASACAAPTGTTNVQTAPATPRAPIRGICFDLFTLFDPRTVVAVAETIVPGQGAALCELWRARQFEYSWLRVVARRYADFRTVTYEALRYAARARRLELSNEAQERLVAAYSELAPWPDTRAQLLAWKQRGVRLAPLSNYSPDMLERLITNAQLDGLFEVLISTHQAQTFKPDPKAYALGISSLGLQREAIAFAAFGGWDAAGATWFGYPTFWVNRLGVAQEALVAPDATGPALADLARFVETWHSAEARSTR